MNEKIYKSETRFKIDWYKVRGQDTGINIFLQEIKNGNSNLRLIKRWHPKKGQYWGVTTTEVLASILNTNKYLYELLEPNIIKKVYFDVDATIRNLAECKKAILDTFIGANLHISGYENDTKSSYHIILSNYTITNNEQLLLVKEFARNFKETLGFDTAVYGKYNVFKCINQSKPKVDAPIQAYIEGSEVLSKHLICQDFDTDLKEFPTINLPTVTNVITGIVNENTIVNLIQINPQDITYELPDNFDYINAKCIDKLNVIPNVPKTEGNYIDHIVNFKIMAWCKSEGCTFEQFWNWCKKKDSSEARQYRYLTYFTRCNWNTPESFIDTLLLKFYPKLKVNRYKELYTKLNNIAPDHIITDPYFKAKYIGDTKYTFLDIRMGGNKTGAILEYIKDNEQQFKRVLFVSPRRALSNDILGRMNDIDLDFTSYENFGKNDKYKIPLQNHLIMSINSIYHLCDYNYDLIIIDEIETIWESFKGQAQTQQTNGIANWKCFMRLIKESKKCIIMDALLSTKTISVIKTNDPGPLQQSSEILTLEKKQDPLQFFKYKSNEFEVWLKAIIKCIKKKEKVFIFMPYKEKCRKKGSNQRHPLANINNLVQNLCKIFDLKENTDIIGYYSEQEEQKDELINIEAVWKKARVIVANTCIAVGNNYSGKDFSHIFAYYTGWVETRDFFQIIKRVRNPISKIIHVFYEKNHPIFDRLKINELHIDDPAFQTLTQGFSIESKTTNKDKLSVISTRCNITHINTNELYDIVKQQRLDIKLTDFSIKFHQIPNITEPEFQVLLKLANSKFTSLLQNLKIEKFILTNKFIPNTPTECLEYIWDKTQFIHKLDFLIKNPNFIMNKILEANNIDLFQIDLVAKRTLSTLKIPNFITNNEIKEAFDLHHPILFRDITLFQRIFNNFFGPRLFLPEEKGKYINKEGKKRISYHQITVGGKQILQYTLDDAVYDTIEIYTEYRKLYQNKINPNCLIVLDDELDVQVGVELDIGLGGNKEYTEANK